MATEELLKLIQEDPMGYEGYLAYAKYLETINLKQAYLTYENALYFCDDETMKKTIQSKLDERVSMPSFSGMGCVIRIGIRSMTIGP